MNDILSGTNPHTRQIFTKKEVASELAPYALHILSPEIDPSLAASSTTVRGPDRKRIANSADALLDLNVQFLKEKLDGGAFAYRLDP